MDAGEKMDFRPSLLTVPINLPAPLDGKPHDGYVVFINPKEPLGSLMVVMGTEFLPNAGAQ